MNIEDRFEAIKYYTFLFYQGNVISFLNVDKGCFLIPNQKSAERAIADLKNSQNLKCHLNLVTHRDMLDYLGINFTKIKYGKLKLTHQQLINQIIVLSGLEK